MKSQQVMFMGWIFAVGTLISLTYAGLWLGSEEALVVDAVTVFKQTKILGTWSVMVPNISFFTVGARALMMLDFAFFSGGMEIFQWLLFMTLGLGLMFGFFTVVIQVINGLFRR